MCVIYTKLTCSLFIELLLPPSSLLLCSSSMNLVILSSNKAAASLQNLVASKAFSTMLHVCLSRHVLMIWPSSSTTSHACNCHLTFTRLQERSNMTFTLIAVTREFISSKPKWKLFTYQHFLKKTGSHFMHQFFPWNPADSSKLGNYVLLVEVNTFVRRYSYLCWCFSQCLWWGIILHLYESSVNYCLFYITSSISQFYCSISLSPLCSEKESVLGEDLCLMHWR